MTARHCISSVLAARPESISVSVGTTRSQPTQTTTVAEVVRSPAGWDLALLRLATPFNVDGSPYGYQLRTYANYSEFLATTPAPQVTCSSWGRTSPSVPPPEVPTSLSFALVGGSLSPLLALASGDSGGSIGQGDAGAPCLTYAPTALRTVLVGVLVGQDGNGNGIAIDMTRPQTNAWVESTILGHDADIAVDSASVPAAASPDGQEIDLFWVDGGGSMNQTRLQPDGSATSIGLGLQADDPFAPVRPAAAYLGAQLHVVGRTASGRVLELVSGGGAPATWVPISSLPAINSGIGLASLASSRLDLFARAADQTIVHVFSDGTSWSDPPDVFGGTSDADVLGMWTDDPGVDVSTHAFSVVGGQVFHKWFNLGDPGWQPYSGGVNGWSTEVYGTIDSAAAILWTGTLAFDMFGRGVNGHLVHKPYVGWWMNDFLDLGVTIPSDPAPVLAGASIHIFARNADGSLWHAHMPR